MNILIDDLPHSVLVGGAEYPIDSGYRGMVQFELDMQNHALSETEKVVKGLNSFFTGRVPGDIAGAVDALIWFYTCGRKQDAPGHAEGGTPARQIYSFEHDADYIYAAFLDQYGLDLQECADLHWWKFKAMFKALRQENEIVKIMGYRTITIDNNMSDSQKRFYAKMKEVHRLPLQEDEAEKLKEIERILMGDGKL